MKDDSIENENEIHKEKEDVIWEYDSLESIKKISAISVFESEDYMYQIGLMKHGTNFIEKFRIKLIKNKYCILSLFLICLIYYFVVFESILPMYEADLINTLHFHREEPKGYSMKKVKNDKSKEDIFISNRGVYYFIIFHIVLILFLISFISTSIMDPGSYSQEYIEIYSLKKYHERYTRFYFKRILSKKKSYESSSNNSVLEFPSLSLKSNPILMKKTITNFADDSDKESIIVDPDEKFTAFNNYLKLFERDTNKLRKQVKYNEYWNLQCFNFKHRSIRENVCRFCVVFKSERSFHCKQCRSCIKKMDHHCFFINNCIGFQSYKLFINLLFYGSLSSACSAIIMMEALGYKMNEYSLCIYTITYMILLFGIILAGSLIFYFMIYHFTLIFKGITQIEDTFRYDQRYDDYYDFLKDISLWKRFRFVFGNNPIFWFLPIKLCYKNSEGYIFK